MDYFYRTVEAAQKQAQSLSLQVSQSAKGLSEQISTHTKSLAEQAASASSSAAEQAGQRWKDLNIQEALQLKAFQSNRPSSAENGPDEAELEAFAITPSFQEYVRSLTYSTFRDFPLDELPAAVQEETDKKVLTPWQERHALLIVQQVKEINELRFVLCPKRMNDAQFWSVYFLLSKKYLPLEAFDPDLRFDSLAQNRDTQQVLFNLQTGFKRTIDSARETAKTIATKATNALQPVDASGPLHEMVASQRGKVDSNGQKPTPPVTPQKAAEQDIDEDLEAYLQTMSEEKGNERESEASSAESEEAADLDDYLNALEEKGSEGHVEPDIEEFLDVAEHAPQKDVRQK